MAQKKVINKGYTLEVISWENDGDNYRTKFTTVDSKEKAERLYRICTELFVSCNNGQGGVGNSMEGEETQTLINYIENNPDLFPDIDPTEEDDVMDYFNDLGYTLMGGSEFYDFRVCESCNVTYSPDDVYLEQVKF